MDLAERLADLVEMLEPPPYSITWNKIAGLEHVLDQWWGVAGVRFETRDAAEAFCKLISTNQ